MTNKKQCPLCGKLIDDNLKLCDDCQNHVDNQYATDLLKTDSKINTVELMEEEPELEEHEEGVPPLHGDNENKDVVTHSKRKLSNGVIFVLTGCVLIVVIGIFSVWQIKKSQQSIAKEERYWNMCVIENTPVSYSKYIVAFQNGKYVDEANRRIAAIRENDNKQWLQLQKSGDINDFYTYLAENPKTPHLERIRFLMDSISWLSTVKYNSADGYKAYLENISLGNISGKYKKDAEEKYKYLSEIRVVENKELDSLKMALHKTFDIFSKGEPKELLLLFTPKAVYLGKGLTSTDIVASIHKYNNEKNVRKVIYTIDEKSVTARRDNKDSLFVDVVANVETEYNSKKIKGKQLASHKDMRADSLTLVLDSRLRIYSLNKK